jgi:Domain of Unknown Function (DUF928)
MLTKTYIGFVTACLLFVGLLVTTPARAGYTPPPQQEPPSDYSKSTGVRGCATKEDIALTLLAPQAYVGQTVSTNPTFAWFVSSAAEIDFRIFQFTPEGKPKQVFEPLKIETSSGITKLTVPEENFKLSIAQKYLWQVAIRCTNGDFIIQRAEFQVQEIPSKLKNTLASEVDGVKKVNLYAEHGFWYDALEEAFKLSEPGKLGKVGSTLVEALAKFENPQASTSLNTQELEIVQKRVQSLQQIATSER